MKRMLIATMIALYAAACGGGTTDEGHHDEAHHEETQGGEHAEHHEEHHGEHHEGMPEGHSDEGDEEHGALPAPLRAYHDVFAPIWHGEESERVAGTCAAAEELLNLATEHHRWAREGEMAEDAAYLEAAAELVSVTRAYGEQCAADPAVIDPAAVAGIHDAFHACLEAGHSEH
ncbi:MAG TPA: hypothetical protein RMH85_31530 [Polyangiaceae bacterium LLY-WYZ-15_(1-7)]|nr:hypothetical protein [Sandaracinus sp.]HJL00721.1 hypothetical protein [Polyangiaceae bacterium LLY-WYZ-15_(1-7)]HJL13056.1 hypothetical protein [Polyangiaceae bacterium LLY-WYZ-15_(1-7)]HJL26011.1 hypothetical protein [Polyangiaceae bacterium LLY-WYZ-15_(1-7)]HJL30931.1 hypothetical protein [Polyangiaceae bacterium LLY-WYZ-15_(1-7)]